MSVNLVGRSFLTLLDYSKEEILYMLEVAAKLKAKKKAGIRGNLLEGKNLVKEIYVPNKIVNFVAK